jgi:hypothetical protein
MAAAGQVALARGFRVVIVIADASGRVLALRRVGACRPRQRGKLHPQTIH